MHCPRHWPVAKKCPKCREEHRAYMRDRLRAFRERHPGYNNKYMRQQREVAREIGFCIECCARPAIKGTRCENCILRHVRAA